MNCSSRRLIGRKAQTVLLILIMMTAWAATGAQTVEPQEPQYNQPITIKYGPTVSPEAVQAVSLELYSDLSQEPETISMTSGEGGWQTAYTVTDTSVKMLCFAFRVQKERETIVENNNGLYYEILMYDGNNPIEGALLEKAVSLTGMTGIRTQNLDKALDAVETELKYHPDNLAAMQTRIGILLQKNNYSEIIRFRIREEIETFLADHKSEADWQFASEAYKMIGLDDKAKEAEENLIRLNPGGERAAMQAFSEIMKIRSETSRYQQLEKFLQKFSQSSMTEIALSQMASIAISQQDTIRAKTIGARLLAEGKTMAGSNALAALAGMFTEDSRNLGLAWQYIQKSLEIIESIGPSDRPPALTDNDWDEQKNNAEARYREIMGWLKYKKKDFDGALEELKKSELTLMQPGLYFRIALVLESMNRVEEAAVYYARASAFEGEIGTSAYNSLQALWSTGSKPTTELQAFQEVQSQWVENENKRRILRKRISKQAPDFQLRDRNGDWVRLSDQKGSMVLVLFWATWSRSSLRMMDLLEDLAGDYGRNVLFLAISTDSDKERLISYIRKKRPLLPVLRSKGTEQDYGLQGVPMLYVIDKKGWIQFEHKGYNPTFESSLRVEMDTLLSE